MMLEVQKFLQDHNLQDLRSKFGVEHKHHPTLPLVLLDYNQIECEKLKAKKNGVVLNCRGLVLENETWKIVSKSFDRFFNLAEYPEDFDWSGPIVCTAKHDGSLIKISWYEDRWIITTRNSWADGQVNNSGFTWRELVLQHVDLDKLNKDFTYVGELCGPYNRVVRDYPPSFFLLSVFLGEQECNYGFTKLVAENIGLKVIESYSVYNKEDVEKVLYGLGEQYPDFEGVVLKDCNGLRVKWKRDPYLALHHMVANGNIASPKYLVPILLGGERDEVLSYFKWLQPYADEYQARIDRTWKEIDNTWFCFGDEKNRKKFALAITKSTKYTWPLFQAFITGKNPKEFFTTDYILKNIFGDSSSV